jgi:endonuclease-3 related protein
LNSADQIRSYFRTLYGAWGRQHWWPGDSRFEVIVGAYLTQNTSWPNVERALASLRQAHALSVAGVRRTPEPKLAKLIRSSGYFRQKARRLKIFVKFLDGRYHGSLARMFAQPTAALREELLSLNGVGPETADSILLYAGGHPSFVVDAYTRRILERHELIAPGTTYDEIRELFEQSLKPLPDESPDCAPNSDNALRGSSHPPSRISTARRGAVAQMFNEMHGLIVGVGKAYCKKSQPDCERCPLNKFLPERKWTHHGGNSLTVAPFASPEQSAGVISRLQRRHVRSNRPRSRKDG